MSSILLDRRMLLVAGASAFALSACSGIVGPPESPPLYVLRPVLPPAGGGSRVPWQLSVVLPEAPDSLDTNRIALIQPNGTMDFYANASWQDRLSLLVQGALIDAFEASGRLAGVARDTEGLKSEYLLTTDIRDFEARYDAPDGIPTAVVKITAKVFSVHGRVVARTIDGSGTATASANTVPAAVQAINEALGIALGKIVGETLMLPMPPRD
jgi:cholesterol transport system auxiliary component